MAAETTNRILRAYRLHAHLAAGPPNYLDFFTWIGNLRGKSRAIPIGDRIVALGRIQRIGEFFRIIVYEGEKDQLPLLYDILTSKASTPPIPKGSLVATPTHVLISTSKREAIIEYNHKGAKHTDLQSALAELLVRKHKDDTARFDIMPIPDASFLAALNRFTRVRVASVVMAEPNYDWSDAANRLSKLAQESDGKKIRLEVTAHRSRSLNRRKGILQIIRSLFRKTSDGLEDIKVTGTKDNDSAETTISLENYTEQWRTTVKKTKAGYVDSNDMFSKLAKFNDARSVRG